MTYETYNALKYFPKARTRSEAEIDAAIRRFDKAMDLWRERDRELSEVARAAITAQLSAALDF